MINIQDFSMYLRYFWKNLYLKYLYKIKGLDFGGRQEAQDHELRGYEGCYPVNKILKKAAIRREDSILDIGCGKGLFLYYASQFPFDKLDGIEYSAELVETAKKNFSILSNSNIHVYHCDARNFSDYHKYNYFFVNNPFSSNILEEVVDKIKKSCSTDRRKIVVIYQFPFSKNVFLKHGFTIEYDKFPNMILTYVG